MVAVLNSSETEKKEENAWKYKFACNFILMFLYGLFVPFQYTHIYIFKFRELLNRKFRNIYLYSSLSPSNHQQLPVLLDVFTFTVVFFFLWMKKKINQSCLGDDCLL